MAEVVLYQEASGRAPLIEWLDGLSEGARMTCLARIRLLSAFGHDLRRPHADLLHDGIHELRAKHLGVNYRMLYFFHARMAVLTHGLIKQRSGVPELEIGRAIRRRAAFVADPNRHTHRGARP